MRPARGRKPGSCSADDEPLARRGLARLVAAEGDLELVGQCADGIEAIAAIRRERPDLLLLDVQMPGKDGFEVLAALTPQERPVTIFVTAFDAHALQAFDVHAVDYVLKPVQPERFAAAVAQARIRALLGAVVPTSRYLERFLLRSTGAVSVIPVRDVRWIEADGDYVRLHAAGAPELMRATLHSLEERLDPRMFARVHRSCMVRLDEVREVRGAAGGDGTVVLRDGAELPLSRTYRERLLAALDLKQ